MITPVTHEDQQVPFRQVLPHGRLHEPGVPEADVRLASLCHVFIALGGGKWRALHRGTHLVAQRTESECFCRRSWPRGLQLCHFNDTVVSAADALCGWHRIGLDSVGNNDCSVNPLCRHRHQSRVCAIPDDASIPVIRAVRLPSCSCHCLKPRAL